MNVHHVRFCAAAVFAAFVSGAAPLAAQSARQADARDASPALTAIGIVPTSLDSVTAAAAQPAADASSASTAVVARGPSVASARVASHAISTSRGAPPVIQNKTSNKNSVALMIVGGAALVVGAVIGDDAGTLVMLGGAGVGLYGLYLFLT
jgi:hypothetical protein